MPSYLKKHKNVLKDNERVHLLGEWAHGFFAMSFIGALNVGSITLHFDDVLKSNIRTPEAPYILDKNYTLLMNHEDSLNVHGNQFIKIPQLKKAAPRQHQEPQQDMSFTPDDLTQYLNEFDIRDIPSNFVYSTTQEQKLAYNMLNGFKLKAGAEPKDEGASAGKEQAELASKLERPSSSSGLSGRDFRLSSFTITPQGVELHKGEELGMF